MKSFFRFLFSVRTIVLALLVLAALGGGGCLWWYSLNSNSGPGFHLEPVERKNLSATITATGTLEPEEVIDVGAQVAGLILNFGPADPKKPDGPTVDYCTPVTKGQILANIDPTIYQAHLDEADAALATAQAAQASAEANLAKSEANRDAMQDAYRRDVASPGAVNQQQIVSDKAAYQSAAADCTLQEAAIRQAKANVKQATATLKEAQTNLNYCTITAPVDGVIVDRRVNVGQTVVSSLSAPSLFLLAKDLTKMQVWASVNEADIGNIHVGQGVTFTVDARPGKIYKGEVSQIRLNASMTQNVVTYTVVVETTNRMIDVPPQAHAKMSAKKKSPQRPDSATTTNNQPKPEDTVNTTPTQELELLPYLTANLTFHVANREDALLVPNAALRWRPQPQQVDPKYQQEYENSLRKRTTKESGDDSTESPKADTNSGNKNPAKPHEGSRGAASHGMVWVQVPNSTLVRPIKVETGLTDGVMTEVERVITDDNLHKDDALEEEDPNATPPKKATMLITGESTGPSAAAATNPFAPKIFQRQPPKKQDGQK